ncbi:MAG TPA: serine hydrolase domain-containing protein [Jatrophihabitans sp.]|nr:serine hydrolase domain-containing protein [Jatrophihabitans sp.]
MSGPQVDGSDFPKLLVMVGGATSVGELETAMRAVGERPLGIEGLHVAVHGRRPVEQHWVADIRRDVFSASKTVTSMAVGNARAEGFLDLDDPVLAHLGNLIAVPSPEAEQITIQHLLTMSSGITHRWEDPDADHPDDPAVDILNAPLGAAPGSRFAYRGANTYLLSRVIHACSGQDLRDYLLPRLFTPLGIHNPQWLRCPRGYSLGAVGLHLRTEELARLTRVLLDHGRWDGRPVVPADYVDSITADTVPTDGHIATAASAPHPDNARYGRHVWMCARDDAWRMDGIYGQFGIVLPNQQACVTVTAHYRGPTTDILDAIWSEIVPALS